MPHFAASKNREEEENENVARVVKNESGAEVVEVGIWAALIIALAIALIATLGGEVQNAFQTIVDQLTAN